MMVVCRTSWPFGGRLLGIGGVLLLRLGIQWQTCQACEGRAPIHIAKSVSNEGFCGNTHQSSEPWSQRSYNEVQN